MKKATGAGGRGKRVRHADAKKPKTPKTPKSSKRRQRPKAKQPRKSAKKKTAGKAAKKPLPKPAAPEFEIHALDPLRKCGPDTSVEQLYRIDERTNGQVRTHLVFFDRHGWYCEHGRDCPAVAPARKAGTHARHTGPTHNGRTRA